MRREDAEPGHFEAAKRGLALVSEILDRFEGCVIAGGNVPPLLIPEAEEPHEGTVDIDLVLADKIVSHSDLTLHEELERALFQRDETYPFKYHKSIEIDGKNYRIVLELLGGGVEPALREILSEDVYVSVIEGIEVALESPVALDLETGGRVYVASLPTFFAMKAAALDRRAADKKAKDAYDIVYCLTHFPGGLGAIVAAYQPYLDHPIVLGSLRLLATLFRDGDSVGPRAYAERAFDEDKALEARRALTLVNDLLDRLP